MKIELFDRLDVSEEDKKLRAVWFSKPFYQETFCINDNKITVPGSIYKAFEIQGVCLVHFISDSVDNCKKKGYDGSRNIWAFDANGTKLWEIEHPVESIMRQRVFKEGHLELKDRAFDKDGKFIRTYIEDGEVKEKYDTYTTFNIGKQQYEGKVFVATWNCFTGELNPQTGQVTNWLQGR